MPSKSYAHRGVDRFDNEAVFVDVSPSVNGTCYRRVFCDEENCLAFHHLDEVEGVKPLLVALCEVLETDDSLVDVVSQLEPGMRAFRDSGESDWTIVLPE